MEPCSSWPDATALGLVSLAPNPRRSNSGQGQKLMDRLTMLLHRQAPKKKRLAFVSLRNGRCSDRGLRITRLVKFRGGLALRSEDSRRQMNPCVHMDKHEMMAGTGRT